MKKLQSNYTLSAIALFSILIAAAPAKAAPVQFNQVVQVVNVKPGKSGTSGYSQLRLAGDDIILGAGINEDKNKKASTTVPSQPQDDRVITETRAEIVQDDACDCEPIKTGGFPKYALLGLAALPLAFLIPTGRDRTKTSETPTFLITPTPPESTPTPTPVTGGTKSPTPPEPVPEPMTILLFGTGLASIGMAARRKFGKKDEEEQE